METNQLKNIKSNYILRRIFDNIKDKKILLKLFDHSKLFQKKLDIKLFDYKKVFFKNFSFEDYLCFNKLYDDNIEFDKEELKNNLKNDLSKIKYDYKNIVNEQDYLIYHFKKYYNKLKEEELDCDKEHKILIDIYSPFFETLSKTEIFFDLFNIIILPKNIIKKYNLLNDYINYFEKIKKFESKYTSISSYYGKKGDLDILNESKININNLGSLIIFIINLDKDFSFSINEKDINFKNKKKIRIDSKLSKSIKIQDNSFDIINDFIFLEELQLNDLTFKNALKIKLYGLKKLYISNCKNISFGEDKPYEIEIIELNNCEIIKPKSLLNFPKLKKYFVNNIYQKHFYKLNIFDIINNPKYLDIDTSEVDNINTTSSIEYLNINYSSFDKEINKKKLEKIISMNNLKYFDIYLYNLYNDEISKIPGENKSIERAAICWDDNNDCILYNLQNKFPNLSNLTIDISDIEQGFNQNIKSSIEITENPKCKINQFEIGAYLGMNIKFYIQSFENLVSVSFKIGYRFGISNNNFPIFNNDCKVIFKSLKNFYFSAESCYRRNFDILNNIYNNLDKMPNLKSFSLKFSHKYITEEFVFKFIKKLLLMRLNNIELFLTKVYENEDYHEEYSINELKEICDKININYFNHISIRKFETKKTEDWENFED